jgi:hypothetical protein
MARDPHRAAGCRFNEVSFSTSWFSQLDWAVYHAPGWQSWQTFRRTLVGRSIEEKYLCLRSWPTRTPQDLIRVVNYLRALRGSWSAYPALGEYAAELNPRMEGVRRELSQNGPGSAA